MLHTGLALSSASSPWVILPDNAGHTTQLWIIWHVFLSNDSITPQHILIRFSEPVQLYNTPLVIWPPSTPCPATTPPWRPCLINQLINQSNFYCANIPIIIHPISEHFTLAPVLVLTLGADNDSFVWTQCMGREWWCKHWVKIKRLFCKKSFVGKKKWSWTLFQLLL